VNTRRKFLTSAASLCAAATLGSEGVTALAAQPSSRGRSEGLVIPPKACDCHVHIIGKQSEFPMVPDRAYTPPESSVPQLRRHLAELHMQRVVLIQPSFYGTDNRCIIQALNTLGPMARGIAVIDEKTTDAMLAEYARRNIRGVRINLESINIQDPSAAKNALNALAVRVAPYGWNIQIYASSKVIAASADAIAGLSVPVVLDHFAMMQTQGGIAQADFIPVIELIRSGHAYVKLSAPYRISKAKPGYEDVAAFARSYVEANVARVLWASDWPHTDRAPGKQPTEISPFRVVDDRGVLNLFGRWIPDAGTRKTILVDNPERLFGFEA